jgi:xanthine dehydrogenase accessory factor
MPAWTRPATWWPPTTTSPTWQTTLPTSLRSDARWVGLMGSARHAPPHIEPLRAMGFDDGQIDRIQRPIGIDIGSHTPAEIALATLAGLVADRNNRTVTV